MKILLAACVAEIALTLLFAPVKVRAIGHASLENLSAQLNISVYALTPVRLRLKAHDGKFSLSMNGKPFARPKNISSAGIIRFLGSVRMRAAINAKIIVGTAGMDAMICAIMTAATAAASNMLPGTQLRVYYMDRDGFDVDGGIEVRLSAWDALASLFKLRVHSGG